MSLLFDDPTQNTDKFFHLKKKDDQMQLDLILLEKFIFRETSEICYLQKKSDLLQFFNNKAFIFE